MHRNYYFENTKDMNYILILNLLFALILIFFERRDPKSVWAWLLVLFFVPFLGFVLYLLFGTGVHRKKMFRMREMEKGLKETLSVQIQQVLSKDVEKNDENTEGFCDLIMYNLRTCDSFLTDDNDIDIYVDGEAFFEALLEEIKKAKSFIHLQFYIFKDDALFARLEKVLLEKQREGVKIRVLYDDMGSRLVSKRKWRILSQAGIETAGFFPAVLGRFQPRLNYRNHRKIVVIDNKVAYVGGFNVGEEYLGKNKKIGYWRDTHLCIRGTGVFGLQLRFLLDWNYASGENLWREKYVYRGVEAGVRDHCSLQIVSGGPDRAIRQVRDNYIQLINKAQKRIYLQTPYFVPDEAFLSALTISALSGVEVNLMIPCKADHPFVYWATYAYMGELALAGANCYTYDNGFLHCKGIIIDGKAFCYGTANMDVRSFSLNFEVNAVVYNEKKALEMEGYFREDIKHCTKITAQDYRARTLGVRVREQISRLLSPLL